MTALAQAAGLPPPSPLATTYKRLERLQAAGRAQRASAPRSTGPRWGYAVEVSLRITLDKTDPRAFDTFLAGCARGARSHRNPRPSSAVSMCASRSSRGTMPHYQEIYRDRILTLTPIIADNRGADAGRHHQKNQQTLPL